MREKTLYSLQEELDRISRYAEKVQIFIFEEYSFIGTIEKVELDYIVGKEDNMKKPYVNIPIDKIKYVRLLK